MTNASKQVIPYGELLEKIKFILLTHPECRNLHIDGVEVYKEQIDGANWHITRIRRSGDDNDLYVCRETIMAEIRHLRDCYDVEPRQ